ncbi:ABC transporter substrate-binding protein [Bacillota bacterium Meth-B3]|nr:ABC transporter substrate-binding protein [Christensenellaceae bacterium]
MRKLLALALMVFMVFGSVSVALAEEIDWRAQEGSELMVYGGSDEEHVAAVVKAFEAKTGIKTSFIRMSGNECYTRILEERENPQADVWFGGTWDPYIAAAMEGLLEQYPDCKNAAQLKSAKYKDADNYWFGIYSGYIGFICNKEMLDEYGAPVPTSWEDLAKPEYKGLIVMANPGATGTGVMTVSTLFQVFGEEKALELIKAYDPNVTQYVKTGSATSNQVALGEGAVGVGFLHTGLMFIEDGYDNIVLSAPSEGTGYEVGGTAIIKGCKNPEAAKLFIEFALTPEAQEIAQTVGSLQFLTVEGAKDPEAAQQLLDMGIKLIDYDSQWTGANKNMLIEKWTKAISGDKIAQ